jgi:hypothetical protein
VNLELLLQLKQHWMGLRGRTYDLLDVLKESDLEIKLPFPESKNLYYQFWSLVGTNESFAQFIATGTWKGWNSSLPFDVEEASLADIKSRLEKGEDLIVDALERVDPMREFESGETPLYLYMTLAELESHHHGQMVQFILAHNLPIPKSWARQYSLSRQ